MSLVDSYRADGVVRRDKKGLRIPDQNVCTGEVVKWPLTFVIDEKARRFRLAYKGDPQEDDYEADMLWLRHGLDRSGEHTWATVNAVRTRAMMRFGLCLVCSRPAVDPATGRLRWLLANSPDIAENGLPVTNVPPTCLECTDEALDSCPRLRRRKGRRIVSVAETSLYAVTADIYAPASAELPTLAVPAFRKVNIPLIPRYAAVLPYALALQPWVALEGMRDEPLP